MDRMNPRRLAWTAQRAWLRHGPAVLVPVLVAVAVVAVLLGIAGAGIRADAVDRDIAAQLRQRSAAAVAVPRAGARAVPLPPLADRFAINRKVLEALEAAGFEPERIRFKFETIEDAGLTRQVAAFTLKASWERIAGVLATLQASERSLYIARLRLVRETPADAELSAEIQLAVALVGAPRPEPAP